MIPLRHRSIFSPASVRERAENFEDYWLYTQRNDGEIIEDQRDLTRKREVRERFQARAVRSRAPLSDPGAFYRNCVELRDDPRTLDRTTLLLTFLYKFARHEWVGISAAWEASPPLTPSAGTVKRIGRYHLSEEFCHMRLFHEMFRTFHLDRVEWVPLSPWKQRMYKVFPLFPGELLAPPAFVSELLGLTVYLHLDGVLDDILAAEPEAREHVRDLLREIMADELAHVGQRRNFLGPLGLRFAKLIVRPMYRAFLRDLPESQSLFDIGQMVRDGQGFDYSTIAPEILARSWVPSYCRP
jgi:hypothetical protein